MFGGHRGQSDAEGMFTMKKAITGPLLVLLIVVCSSFACAQSFEQVGEDSKIDWTNLKYIARGEGVVPNKTEEPNSARAYLKAKSYAKMQAIANLQMLIEGTTIDYEATGDDFMANEFIKLKIQGFVRNVKVASLEEKMIGGDKIIEVVVEAPMFGEKAPGTVFLEERAKQKTMGSYTPGPVKVEPPKEKPDMDKLANVASAKPSPPGQPYTSLIVDGTGLDLRRAMSPKIRTADGEEVWGTVKVDYDFLQEKGIVVYANSLAAAKTNSRAGSNPMVVDAIAVAGGKFYCDAVVSYPDADLIRSEEEKGNFLSDFSVIFVLD